MEGMTHLPPPPSVPLIRPAALVVAMAKAVRKAAPKPPTKMGVSVPYGSYATIRVVLKHFGGHLATDSVG